MRLRVPLLLLALLAAAAGAQTWEKHVAPGITYRMEFDAAGPRLVHALRFSLNNPTAKAAPELGELKIYSSSAFRGRETIGALVRRAGAIAGINADFFPPSGDPLGLMVRDGELLSLPHPDRTVFAWGAAGVSFGRATSSMEIAPENGDPIRIDGFNQECGLNDVCLFSEASGLAVAKEPSVRAVIDFGMGKLPPSGEAEGTVRSVEEGGTAPVAPGTFVLAATGPKRASLSALKKGGRVRLRWRVEGFDWSKFPNAVGGGPSLLRDGRATNEGEREGFTPAFSGGRHPRTAVGRTADGDVWFVAVDGRQPMSVGATLAEMVSILKGLGCTDAVNLDGGGSTTFHVLGATLNRPSDGRERAVANGILFFGPRPAADARPLRLAFPEKMVVGESASLKVFAEDGEPLPNIDLLWSAMGPAWIDQGGQLRAFGEGTAEVAVSVRGRVLTAKIPVAKGPRE